MNANVIISETGKINGRGSMPYKWVSGLTKSERDAVKNGKTVLIADDNDHPMCTPFKQVIFSHGRFSHRNYYGSVK